MAISWGGVNQHEMVGIDVRTDAYDTNTPSINVYVDFYVASVAWGFGDGQTLSISGSIGGAFNFTFSAASGSSTTQYVGTVTIPGQGQDYPGGPTYTFRADLSGQYLGGTPWHSIAWALPPRPANVPTTPGLGVDSVTSTSARAVVSASADRGAVVDWYGTWIATDPGFTNIVSSSAGGTYTATGLVPATTYYVRSQSHNVIGYSAYSPTVVFTTGATIPGTPSGLGSSSVAQTTATLSWGAPGNGGSAISYYEIQLALDAGFTWGLQSIGDWDGSPGYITTLSPGTLYYARVRAINGVGPGPFTAAIVFTTLAGTPSILFPMPGQLRTDGYSSAVIYALGVSAGKTITTEFSQSSTFASGVLTITAAQPGATPSNQYDVANTGLYQKTGVWYVRSKVTTVATGYVTPWSATVTYTQSHTPSAYVQSPGGGGTTQYTPTTLFTWQYQDPSPVDGPASAYRIVIENNATGATVYDSAKVASPATSFTYALDVSYRTVPLRWRVMVWDRGDTASAWSGYGLFTLADPPNVVIVTPSSVLPVTNGSPTFSWTVAVPSGGTQAQAVVRVFDADSYVQVWEATVGAGVTSVTPPIVILTNQQGYFFTVDVVDSFGLTDQAYGTFETNYVAPSIITYSIDASVSDSLGYVNINWSNANADALFVEWKVYRRTLPSNVWELLTTIGNQNVRVYKDYMLNAGETYSYSVTQVATRSGVFLESPVGYYFIGTVPQVETRTYAPEITNYWIINPDTPDLSVRLSNVISDDNTLNFEQASYTIIGRGRHVDYGDELGYSGTLVVQVRGVERPSPVRLAVENLRRAQETYYLRTPFGRMFQIAIGDIGWSPLKGVGIAEMGDMTIPYEQVN